MSSGCCAQLWATWVPALVSSLASSPVLPFQAEAVPKPFIPQRCIPKPPVHPRLLQEEEAGGQREPDQLLPPCPDQWPCWRGGGGPGGQVCPSQEQVQRGEFAFGENPRVPGVRFSPASPYGQEVNGTSWRGTRVLRVAALSCRTRPWGTGRSRGRMGMIPPLPTASPQSSP